MGVARQIEKKENDLDIELGTVQNVADFAGISTTNLQNWYKNEKKHKLLDSTLVAYSITKLSKDIKIFEVQVKALHEASVL